VRRLITPGRLAGAGLVLLAAVAVLFWVAPASSYLILPDRAKPLEARVAVPGERPDRDGGGIYYVDVIVRKASLLEERVARFRPEGANLVPEHAIVPPGTDFGDRRRQNLREMDRSQEIAAAVALRELGRDVKADPEGALVVAVADGAPADGEIEPTDVIVGVDGKRVQTPEDLRRLIAEREVGDRVRLRVRGGGATRTVELETVESTIEPGRPIIGVQVEQNADIELPVDVEIDLGGVGGPSAGLAFALDIVEELRGDVDRGNRVAATGEMQLDGTVAPVGGIEQKTIGARRAGADVFLVPAGENAAEARRNAAGLRIIPVENFQQALRQLRTLPRKK
jgi:PDZ domain-containing protein